MRTLFELAATVVAASLLAGCGGEDFNGAYRFKDSNVKGTMVLNVHGDEAELFVDFEKDGIKPLGKMKVSVKEEKLILDAVNGSTRLVMRRNVDERSLDCLNCKVLGTKKDDLVWNYDPNGPYDVGQLLKDQARKNEEAMNAEFEKMQQKAREQDRRNAEAPKLTSYEGDWVYQRTTKQDPLTIMTIWRKSQIKIWSFNFENMDYRLGHEVPKFEVTEAGLKIGDGPKAHLYTLSADKNILTCMDCTKSQRWVKTDPKKDLSDRHYARQMAGNP
ncbi:hypothetical protein [Pseudomonas sp. TNT3]|uniref:hypothetical protein n=1 Tax=Pseudomonas sp. TNT3 TaxID=2654097 RepID=UPI00139163B0|nr:hypothetical protein [Pseudomonas sp. TNT3]KAI2693088.1 hypothetical protein GBC55_007705 [Pseudomonas sp. TNT3]